MASVCASSPSMLTLPRKRYNVFTSFRGEDTRNHFISHLRDALCRRKIETYIDDRLGKGNELWPALEEAIENSSVFVVVFSENYASSTWCLKELTKIMEQKAKGCAVIPVFYKVDPSDVRSQKGSYGDAFAKHELNFFHNREKLINWRSALTTAANLVGWNSCHRAESELIEDIVNNVSQILRNKYQSDELKGIVGVDENYAKVESLLRIQESVERLIIGLWGMGGIGKTTIATALVAELHSQYESSCFLENVREKSRKHGLSDLRRKLISELLGLQYDTSISFSFVKDQLIHKKVLIVLDDVDTIQQMEYLCGEHHRMGPGSRVVVTSRDKHVLSGRVDEIYEVKALAFEKSLQLFTLHAFKQDRPKEGYEDLSNSAVSYAQGVPLALKVLGSFLRPKSKKEWESALQKLKMIPHEEIHNVLKMSYDGLDDKEQDIFLDIVFFLKGVDKEDAIRLLDSFGFFGEIGISTLLNRALITISKSNTIRMHDLMQDTGREIIRQQSTKYPGRRSRLWDQEEILDVFKNDLGTETVEGIILNVSEIRDISLSSDAFTKMSRLRVLKFFTTDGRDCNVHLPNGLKALSSKLGYFRWDKYPSSNLPSTFCAEKLVELSMANSAVKRLWEGVQNVVNLMKIDLNGCKELDELPDLSRALNLEYVWLRRCKRLHHLHPSILSLYTLVELDLTECTELESLGNDIHFRAVVFFHLRKCTRLQEISVTDKLPSSMPHLHKLEELYLWSGEDVENIPNRLRGQRFLHQFDLSGCNLIKLPSKISFLSSLYELLLSGNSNLKSLPTSIKNLPHLKKLDLSYCSRLESLPQLPLSIEILNASYCTSLRTVYSPMPEVELIRQYFALFHFCCFSFVGCMELYESAFESIMAYARIRIKQAMKTCSSNSSSNGRVYVYFPKFRLPEWFSYRTTKGPLTLPVHPSLKGFILYMILPQICGHYQVNSLCKFYAEASNGKIVDFESRCPGRVTSISDPVYASIWYDPQINLEIIRAIQTVSALDPRATSSIKMSFQFYAVSAPPDSPELKPAIVEEMQSAEGGVYPIYASGFDDFLKQRGLEVDFGNKTKRRRDTDDDLELKTTRIRVEGREYDEQQLLPFTTKKSALQHLGLELELEPGAETNIDELEQSAGGVGIGVSDQQVLHDRTNKLKEFTFQPLLTETFMQQLHEQQLFPCTTNESALQHLESGLELEQGTETNIDGLEQSAGGVGGSDRESQREQQVLHDRTNKLKELTFQLLSTETCMQNGRTELKELHFLQLLNGFLSWL